MPQYVVSYDLETTDQGEHAAFIRDANTRGWSEWGNATDGSVKRLPNTTLWADFRSFSDARASFLSISAASGLGRVIRFKVTKYLLVETVQVELVSDEIKP